MLQKRLARFAPFAQLQKIHEAAEIKPQATMHNVATLSQISQIKRVDHVITSSTK